MKSLTLHFSLKWHLRRGLSTLQQGLNNYRTEFKYSVPQTQSPFETILLVLWTLKWQAGGPSPPRGKPQDLPMEPSPQGSWWRRSETPKFPDNCVPHKQARSGTSHPTSIQHPSRKDVFLSTCEIPTRHIPASFSGNLLLRIATV